MKTSNRIKPIVFSQVVKMSKNLFNFRYTDSRNMAVVEMETRHILLLMLYLMNIFQDRVRRVCSSEHSKLTGNWEMTQR